jgi:hypothetical protein
MSLLKLLAQLYHGDLERNLYRQYALHHVGNKLEGCADHRDRTHEKTGRSTTTSESHQILDWRCLRTKITSSFGRTLSVPRSLVFGVGSIRDERGAMWLRSWSRKYNLAFISACVKVICGMCLRYGSSIVGNCRGTFRVWCRCVDLYVSWGRIKILFSPDESQKEARPFFYMKFDAKFASRCTLIHSTKKS